MAGKKQQQPHIASKYHRVKWDAGVRRWASLYESGHVMAFHYDEVEAAEVATDLNMAEFPSDFQNKRGVPTFVFCVPSPFDQMSSDSLRKMPLW